MINVESNLDEVRAALAGISNRLPTIMRNAINDTAFEVRKAEQDELRRALDRPTPWTIKTIYVTKATKERLSAVVGPTDYFTRGGFSYNLTPWEAVISHNVYGGTRQHKAFERRLHAAGILPQGWFAVPGPGAKRNQYGNMSSGEIVQILTYVNAMSMYAGDNTSRRNRMTNRRNAMDRRGEAYFAAIPGRQETRHLHPGIYKRYNRQRRIVPVLFFVSSVNYQRIVEWDRVGEQTVRSRYPVHFDREFNLAVQRSRSGSGST